MEGRSLVLKKLLQSWAEKWLEMVPKRYMDERVQMVQNSRDSDVVRMRDRMSDIQRELNDQRQQRHLQETLAQSYLDRLNEMTKLYADCNRGLADWLALHVSNVPIFDKSKLHTPTEEEITQSAQERFPKPRVHGRDAVNRQTREWMERQVQMLSNLEKEMVNGANASAAAAE